MGQFANDWNQLKALIRQKDDALERQAKQIADLQTQMAALTKQQLDTADQGAIAEMRQTVKVNATATPAAPIAAASPAPVTTFIK